MEEIVSVKKNTERDINKPKKECQSFYNNSVCLCLRILEEEGIKCAIHTDICERCDEWLLHSLKTKNLESAIVNGHINDSDIIEKLKRLEELKGSREGIKETFIKIARNGIYLKEELIDLAKKMGLDGS